MSGYTDDALVQLALDDETFQFRQKPFQAPAPLDKIRGDRRALTWPVVASSSAGVLRNVVGVCKDRPIQRRASACGF
jgi:hypothetical protein